VGVSVVSNNGALFVSIATYPLKSYSEEFYFGYVYYSDVLKD
jgi:hypothetical protein|tara:strand:- start:636 stop:761 length:126 start_codon:yes stop_codon:yes gene_type:complete